MTLFRRLALFSTIGTYVVIFAGGLVRVSGAGLGCPDWPKCFGRWIPPLSISDLPSDMNPAAFNFTLAWIEYINRLAGMALGLLIAATAVTAIAKYRKDRRILWSSILAALLVAFQGWQGGQVVLSELLPSAVSLHLLIALAIVNLLIYVTQHATFLEIGARREVVYPRAVAQTIALLWAMTVVQIVLGTFFRSSLEHAALVSPLASDHELLATVGAIEYAHLALGIILAIATIGLGIMIYRHSALPSPTIRISIWMVVILIGIQMSLGTGLIAIALPPLLQLFHVWTASLISGILVVLYTSVRREALK